MEFHKAVKRQARLRLGITGPAGAGKTYTALKIAFGLGGTVGIIDTEHRSSELYEGLGDYSALTLEPPYSPERYIQALTIGEENFDIVIIDSLSHAWAGVGGVLEILDKTVTNQSKKNSYTAWRSVTPKHNALVEAMLRSKAHVIATMRSKQAYAMDDNPATGRAGVRKLGMQPVQREGLDYEFTVVLDMNEDHIATSSKDRTGLFPRDEPFQPGEDTGARLLEWLESGAPPLEPVFYSLEEMIAQGEEQDSITSLTEWYRGLTTSLSALGVDDKATLIEKLAEMKKKLLGGS